MGYVDAFDRNAAHDAEVRKATDARMKDARAEHVENREHAKATLFGSDDRRMCLDRLVKADLDVTRGHVRPAELQAAQDAAWAALEPVINEVPGRPLSTDAIKELWQGRQRAPASPERVAELIGYHVSKRTRVYETKSSKVAELATMNVEYPKSRPRLHAYVTANGGGNSLTLARELVADAATSDGRARVPAVPEPPMILAPKG